MNLLQPAAPLREFYDFDAKFHKLDRYVMWPSIRLVVLKILLFQAVAFRASSVSGTCQDDP